MEPDKKELELYIERLVQDAAATFWGFLGCQLASITGTKVVVTLDVKPHHLNPIGILHGGVLSSLLDNAMGISTMVARRGEKVVTTNLNVHFVAPIKAGKVFVSGEVVHQSRKMITTEGRITDQEGNLSAVGSGSFRVI